MVVEYHSNGTTTEEDNNSHPRYLSASLCCIWEQPAVVLPPPPPPRTTVFVRPPESRRPRCLADRASWAGFSSNSPIAPGVARGRSNVLMGTQVLHQPPGTNPLYGTRDLPQASSTPLHPQLQSQQNDVDDRLDPPVGHPPHPVAFAMDVRKHGRRRSRELGAGRQSQLRSPAVARPPTARVTLQGWLHKQGSEGLMLWKRRWFVLSEYCLFYYKGPEEEKLLGSILLPSYKVSPCAPDDRVFRKFCFKAEHQNMRTYFFAADSRELMVRWMNALSLASILQTAPTSAWIDTESGRPSVSSISQSADDSDSGFHGYRSPRGATTAVTPRQGGDGSAQPPPSTTVIKDLAQSGTLPNSEANGWPPRLQPLYANAPPKPRRLNSQHGDSPDPSPDRAGSRQTPPPAQTKESDYGSRQQQLVTPPRGYGGPPSRAPYHFHPQVNGPTERRTPDTYGRSNNVSRADYEDVYGDRYGTREGWPPPPPQAYMTEGYGKGILQPGQPYPVEPAYIKNTPPQQQQQIYQVDPNYVAKNQTPQGFTPEGTYAKGVYVKPAGPARLEYNPITPPTTLIKQPLPYPTFRMSSPAPTVLSVAPAVQPRPKPPSGHPPRPHSADFLEKDTRYIPETSGSVVMRRDRSGPMTERPKSSVDMYHDYWSEESYAQKMRQSLYLHAHAQPGRANTPQQRPADARLRPPSVERIERGRTPQLSPQSPANTTPRRYEEQQQQNANSARRYSEQAERNANSNLFMRSASARLPRQRASSREEAEQQEMGGGSERKIQQREESMQRLLEWKQRMLQSPLTRKSSPRPHDAGAAPSPLSHLLLRGAQDTPPTPGSDAGSVSLRPRRQPSRGASSSSTSRSRSQDPGRRSAPPPHRRNSYSSDDEEVRREARSNRRSRRPSSHHQAGRSTRTGGSNVVVPVTGEQTPQQPDSSLPSPSPDYVNVNALNERRERPERADNLSNELRQMRIPPDASYTDSYTKQRPAVEKKPSPLSKEQVILPGSKYNEQLSLGVGHFYPAMSSKTALTATTHKLLSPGMTEDRGSNGKHSDSGYDTLRAQEAAEAKRSALRSPIAHPLLCEPADESHLIKEFSYQYIHETALAESTHQKLLGRHQKQISPKNLIQNKIKTPDKNSITSLEREVSPLVHENVKKQDGLKMQEPLQPSQPIYHSNEAHVSSIKSAERENEEVASQDIANVRKSRQNNLRTFAFGESSPEDKVTSRRKQSSNPKSVRDLLADFERKSAALAKEQQAEQERSNVLDAAGRRCVFSDTETLLYDTSSDTELPVAGSDEPRSKREGAEPCLPRQHPRRCVSRAGDRSEDEEDDEEVAAALGRREKFFSSCRDLGRRKDNVQSATSKEAVNINVRRRKVSRGKSQSNVDEVIVTPGYLRLSLAESMVAHEDSASSRSSPSPNPPMNELPRVKTPEVVAAEEHYMPMTPSRRAVLAPPASCLLLEESSYVEMGEDGGVRSLPSVFKRDEVRRLNSGDSTATYATPDSPRYCEIDDDKEESSHYEFLYHATTKYEPVYMEVRPIDALKPLNLSNKSIKDDAKSIDSNKDSNNTPSGSKTALTGDDNNTSGAENLPDILNSTNGSTQQGKIDDSEDADDEASKDLDSLDTPRHPRFSLSDTFRPASYYLGASECAPEQHDSSDSDLVSPPPIPTSPPPLDEELEEDFSLELRKNSHSTPSETRKFPDATSSPSRSDRRSLQGSFDGSIVSDTLTDSSRLKRRPVSEEMLNSLEENSFLMNSMSESISGASTITSTTRDRTSVSRFSLQDELRARDALLGYPKDLTYGFSEAAYHKETFQQRENMYATNKPAQKDNKSEMLLLSNRVRFASAGDESIREIPPPINPDSILMRSRHIRSPSLEEALNSNLDIQQAAAQEVAEAAKASAQTSFDSGAEIAGAPYYYSDLLRADEDGFASSTSEISLSRLPPLPQLNANMAPRARIPQLNNQRDMLDANKRNDIGRKVNPIISAPMAPSPSSFVRIDIEDVDVTRIAAEIRTTTAGLAAKSVSVDSRNIYEADTLRKMARRRQHQVMHRRRSQTPDPDLQSRNLYPHGLRDKSDVSFESRRRSRSLEGLLDDDEQFLDPPRLPPTAAPQERRRRSSGTPRTGPGRSTAPSEGSDPWEEDVLWRESLRRVSLRHTRSLDDLDEDESSPAAPGPSRIPPSGRRSVDMLSSRDRVARVSREVTYVNDTAARNRMLRTKREVYETDYREGRRGGPCPPPPPPQDEEEDTGVYERLARTSESLERSRRGQTYVEGYEWDVDRETFRQGVVPESTQVPVRERERNQQQQQKQQQQQQQHFLEESLPPSFEIDREKLRQWDLLSSAPLEGGVAVTAGTVSTTTASTTSHQRPVGGEGREGSIIANPNIPPTPALPNTGEAGGGGRHLETATMQPHQQQQQQQHIGGRVPPPPPPPPPVQQPPLQPPEGSGSGSVRDSLPASRSNGTRHQQRTSPMAVQPPSQAASNTPLQGSLTGGGGGTFTTGAGPGSRGASPQRLLNGGGGGQHSGGLSGGLLSAGDQPDESTNTSDSELIRKPPPPPPPGPGGGSWSLNSVSAGDLLGRTHEELVLLLIQLRRESAALRHAAELCRADALSQARLAELDASRRAEHLRRLEELKRHLQEIEKQYEKGKPLVHLVDNMVKLGSLYRGPSPHSLPRHTSATPPPLQRLEFNLQVQEQRLLAEERREWNRLSPPDHSELQAKVQQLYRLDRLLQEESVTIQSLQQDKALLERALGGLRHKLAGSAGAEAERYRRQQRLLERELSRIRHLLAANSKKLEETVAENARLEHELVLLRQKLQASRRVDRSSSPATVNAMGGSSTAALEMELRRVQSLVGDLQRQRHDLSAQVRQLTEKSQCLAQQIRPGPTGGEEAAVSTRRRHSSASSNKHRRPSSSWLETDLDSLHTQDVGLNDSAASPPRPPPPQDPRAPLYVNTDALEVSGYLTANRSEDTGTSEELSPPPPPAPESAHSTLNGDMSEMYEPQDISEADDRMKRFYGIIPRAEKPEIKTVRIVKRESERRNRVKRPNTLDGDLIRVMEEDPPQPPPPSELELSLLLELQAQQEEPDPSVLFQRSLSLPRGFGKQPPPPPPMRAPSPRSESGTLRAYASRYRPPSPDDRSVSLSAHAQLFGMDVEHVTAAVAVADEDICLAEGSSSSGPVSPVYQSEAARAIVQEMTRRRSVPRTKRRHHTVAGRLQPVLGVAPSPTGAGARARDDLDMERALRRRVAGAPDVVRSTLSQRELKYNETTIDSILGTPNKILIPERYVPEQEPEMSAEEQLQRLKKAESIRKMLSETTPIAPETQPPVRSGDASEDEGSTMKLKLAADKRQREHLLHLNQLLAQQVMEKSKMVAVRALATTPRKDPSITDDDDLSPVTPLPLVQQRDNFYS